MLTPRSTRPRGPGRRRSQPRSSSLGGSRRASTCRCGSGRCCFSRGASSPRSCANFAHCFFQFSAVAARTHHLRSKRRIESHNFALVLPFESVRSQCRLNKAFFGKPRVFIEETALKKKRGTGVAQVSHGYDSVCAKPPLCGLPKAPACWPRSTSSTLNYPLFGGRCVSTALSSKGIVDA